MMTLLQHMRQLAERTSVRRLGSHCQNMLKFKMLAPLIFDNGLSEFIRKCGMMPALVSGSL